MDYYNIIIIQVGGRQGGGGKSHQHKLWPDGPLEFIRVPCLIWIVSFQ